MAIKILAKVYRSVSDNPEKLWICAIFHSQITAYGATKFAAISAARDKLLEQLAKDKERDSSEIVEIEL